MPLHCYSINLHLFLKAAPHLTPLQDLCRDHGLWLHLEGHALSGLTLVPASGSCVHGDSMTLTFGSWIGIPAVPFVTLYRYIEYRDSVQTNLQTRILFHSDD